MRCPYAFQEGMPFFLWVNSLVNRLNSVTHWGKTIQIRNYSKMMEDETKSIHSISDRTFKDFVQIGSVLS